MQRRQLVNRSRNGCLTCRIRRVKCDEIFPVCKKCKDTGRRCEGPSRERYTFVSQYNPKKKASPRKPSSPSILILTPPPSPHIAARDAVEARAFSYFLDCVAPSLTGGFDSDFWTLLLPQICLHDDVIRHAVLAISDFYEHPPQRPSWNGTSLPPGPLVPRKKSDKALTWYNKSLSRFHDHLQDPDDAAKAQLALLSCLLYLNLEFQQNNVKNAIKLLNHGYEVYTSILNGVKHESKAQQNLIEEIILPMFTKQVVLMACFIQHPPMIWVKRLTAIASVNLQPMTDLKSAQTEMLRLICKNLAFVISTGILLGEVTQETFVALRLAQKKTLDEIDLWHADFMFLLKDIGASLSRREEAAVASLFLYYYSTKMWVATCMERSPAAYTKFHHDFELMLGHAEKFLDHHATQDRPPFTFEIGVLPGLYMVGWKCPDPLFRRRALALMQRAPAQEGLFSAELAYKTVAKLIELDEGPNFLPLELSEFRASVKKGNPSGPIDHTDRVSGVMVVHEDNSGEKVPPALVYSRGSREILVPWEDHATTVLL